MTFGRHFHPARGEVHPELRAILQQGESLSPGAGAAALARASLRLRGLFRTAEPVLTLPAPVEVLREIGLRAAVEDRALVVVSGPDGEALAEAVEALGKEVVRVVVAPGRVLEPAHLERFLAGPEVDTVVLAHADLGAGTLAPLAELSRVVRTRRDLMLFVDATGSLGASPLETDQWGLDFVMGGSEGPLGLPPGLAFAAVSPRLLARARGRSGRGQHLDVVAHHAAATRGQVLGAIPGPMAQALERQLERILDQEGLERRWARHAALAALVAEWAREQPRLQLATTPERRGHAVSFLDLGEAHSVQALLSALAAGGWHLPAAAASEPRRIRIGHMGDLEPVHLAGLLEAIAEYLDREATPMAR